VKRGRALVEDSFGLDAIKLNVPVASKPLSGSTWNPYQGAGSQWRSAPHALGATPAGASAAIHAETPANRMHFNSEQR
jgi:hypothetical protein